MNEQLVVKNFGPIKDATVDFKRVTVFIGPTGGGKSTLAKLAAVFSIVSELPEHPEIKKKFEQYNLIAFFNSNSVLKLNYKGFEFLIEDFFLKFDEKFGEEIKKSGNHFIDDIMKAISISTKVEFNSDNTDVKKHLVNKFYEELIANTAQVAAQAVIEKKTPQYITAERVFVPAVEYSWAGLMRDDIGLPKTLLEFANSFSLARKDVPELDIPFLNIKYLHVNGRDFIKIPDREEPLMLLETASGIQSVTPLLVLLEHLSRNMEQAQSFIIEEPELNLYPTAQQGLLNWLVEKCTTGENDLTITTHSPYILASCNLLLEAYKVAQQRPELEADIAAVVPKEYWINPDEFAAYYVADGTVKPITDVRTHLIGNNELDAISGDIADRFYKLLRLQKQKPTTA